MMNARGEQIPLEQYFTGSDQRSREIFDLVRVAIESIGTCEMRVTKSQIEFRHRAGFAWTWMPAKYLRGNAAPLVLTITLNRRDESHRWKEILEPRLGRFTHHLEIRSKEDIDGDVLNWIREARSLAG
ncbi:DUF5655 domain-containing protein [Paeniglutamicibacter psychrophenolicus]|uniref:DUF5655 domain-containing protein n=1 Tax=Paeniglutamicibacter psychrophenolicus TaxID=257454 RepID=UPI002789DF0C|nr:DUF5655 domain-containing protein [Paeniglutamicibacter psychrophenolicus]MDQ0092506.1 hypothetical protein [Paeniglutamicibacter psychrophenolicus]